MRQEFIGDWSVVAEDSTITRDVVEPSTLEVSHGISTLGNSVVRGKESKAAASNLAFKGLAGTHDTFISSPTCHDHGAVLL